MTTTDPAPTGTHRVYLDTEGNGLYNVEHGHKMWELALDVVDHHWRPAYDGEWTFHFTEVGIDNADPAAVNVSAYYERMTPILEERESNAHMIRGNVRVSTPFAGVVWMDDYEAAQLIAHCINKAEIIGVKPEFDKPFIVEYLRRFGHQWTADHHLIDCAQVTHWRLGRTSVDLPYRSDELARALGVEAPTAAERHTALGDVRWARRWMARLDELAADIVVPDPTLVGALHD